MAPILSATPYDNIVGEGVRQATRLDAIRGRFDPWLLFAFVALASLGVVMVASSSIAIGENHDVGPFYFLTRHLLFLSVGLGLAVVAMRIELKNYDQHSQLLLLLCFVLLLLVFVPGLGKEVNGARRWLNFGLLNFQAVEAVKLLYILWLASYLVRFWIISVILVLVGLATLKVR